MDSQVQPSLVFPVLLHHVVGNKLLEHKILPFSKKSSRAPDKCYLADQRLEDSKTVFLTIPANNQGLMLAKWGIF